MTAVGPLVEVAVPVPVRGGFHYRVPDRLVARARVGARVLVPFGKRKLTGVVVRAAVAAPEGVAPIELAEVLDDEPALSVELVELCLWSPLATSAIGYWPRATTVLRMVRLANRVCLRGGAFSGE